MELIKKENGYVLDAETTTAIKNFEMQVKAIKAKEDELKQMILEEMEKKNIIKISTEDMTISYIAPSKRETFDSKRLKEENPDLYDLYVKLSDVKASIRIKVK